MQLLKIICLATLTMFLCTDLSAQEEKGKRKRRGQQRGNLMQMFQQLDKNGDKQLTEDEIPERLAKRLARLDLDENGTIDAEEVKQIAERMRGRRDRMGEGGDREGKGKGKGKRGRERGDKPDGEASGEGKGKGKDKGARRRKRSDGEGMTDVPSPEQMIKGMIRRFDKNDDQIISKDEAPERLQKNWDRIDQNGNDQLDEDELKQMAKMMQRRGGQGKGKGRRGGDDKPKGEGVKPKKPGSDG